MVTADLSAWSAAHAVAEIARGAVSAEDYTRACLERIAAGKTDAKAQEPTDAELDAQAAAEEKARH